MVLLNIVSNTILTPRGANIFRILACQRSLNTLSRSQRFQIVARPALIIRFTYKSQCAKLKKYKECWLNVCIYCMTEGNLGRDQDWAVGHAIRDSPAVR